MSQFEARMQAASRQLFEMADAEYAEEQQRIASLSLEGVEEAVPPSPQSSCLPVRLQDTFICCFHEIDWMSPLKNGGDTVYKYTDGTEYKQCNPPPGKEMMCADKVSLGHITFEQSAANCRYCRCDDPNTKLPRDFIDFMLKWDKEYSYDSRFDINHPDHYLNHYSSLQELINHLQDPSLFPFDPVQGTTDVFQAQQEINEIESLKQASLESQQP